MNKKSKLIKVILETANDMADLGIIDQKDYEKITMRHLKGKIPEIDPMTSSEEIKSLREGAHLKSSSLCKLS